MSSFNWDAEEFDLEPIDELELLDSTTEVIDGSIEPTLVDIEAEPTELRAEVAQSEASAAAAIEVGDYEAAAYHKQIAEEVAAGLPLQPELEGPSSLELQVADEHQDKALELQSQQAELVQSGDYAAARDLSADAVYEMKAADQLAGGADHSGQAQLEVANLDWADWHQQISNDMLASAADYASHGDVNAAQNYLQGAVNHNDAAEHYGDLGEHGGPIAAVDPASHIESHHVDTYSSTSTTSSISSTSSAVDTSSSSATSIDTSSSDDASV